MGDWLKEVDKQTQLEDVTKIVIANKSDMKKERKVSKEDIQVKHGSIIGAEIHEGNGSDGGGVEREAGG